MPTAPTPIPNITTPVPVTSDPANFDARADLAWTELPVAIAAMNVENDKVYDNAVEAVAAASTATTKAGEAAASALTAVNAPGSSSTSTDSLAIGTGSKSFDTQTGKAWVIGQAVTLTSAADRVNRMTGYVDSYDSGSGAMVVIVTQVSGSGTHADWTIALAAISAIAGRHAMWFPASSLIQRTTNGSPTGNVETATNKVMIRSLDFDPGVIEYAQLFVRPPKSWNGGTLTAVFLWSHGATTTNFKVSWGVQAVAVGDNVALDAAFGAAVYANDTGGTTDRLYISPETAAFTPAGTIVSECLLIVQVLRKADDATNDTLAIDARFEGVTFYFTTDAENDA